MGLFGAISARQRSRSQGHQVAIWHVATRQSAAPCRANWRISVISGWLPASLTIVTCRYRPKRASRKRRKQPPLTSVIVKPAPAKEAIHHKQAAACGDHCGTTAAATCCLARMTARRPRPPSQLSRGSCPPPTGSVISTIARRVTFLSCTDIFAVSPPLARSAMSR